MKTVLALAAPALLLAGGAIARPAPLRYNAQGDAPRWTLSIDRGLMRYSDARTRVAVRAPEGRPSFNGMRYVTPRLTVDVTYATCRDGRGRAFHDSVTVMAGRRTVKGCGGAPVTAANPPRPPMGHGPGVAALDGSAWSIVSVDGIPAATARKTSIRFANGRVEGNAGCNSFGGAYVQRGPVLDASQIVSTQMACVGPGRNIEQKVFRILGGPAQLSFRSGDTLVVTTGGSSMTLSRVR